MKNQIVTICLCIVTLTGYSQNKKEKIAQLAYSLDSLNTVVGNERKEFNSIIVELNEVISKQKNQLEQKSTEIQSINRQLTIKHQELDKQTEQLRNLNNILAESRQELEQLKNQKSAEYLINLELKSVGLFKVGGNVASTSSFNVVKKIIVHETEEGNRSIPIYSVSENGIELLQLWWKYDYNSGKYINQIGEIYILSDKFKTEKGICINSTIEEFVKAYPKAYFNCAELCSCQQLTTNTIGDYIQFELESESIIDWNKCGFDGSNG